MVEKLLTVLREFAGQDQFSKAFRTFPFIQHLTSSVSFDFIVQSVSTVLLSCSRLKLLPHGKQFHSCIISLGLEHHHDLVRGLVNFYSTLNMLVDARSVAENSNILHPLPWTLLISAYVRNRLFVEVLSAYKMMLTKGVNFDCCTFSLVLKACAKVRDLDFGREVHRSINDGGFHQCLFVQNALISMYAKCREVNIARALFDIMVEKDTVSWNAMIGGYVCQGMWENAFLLFETAWREGVEFNHITYNTIAVGCLYTSNFTAAFGLISHMWACGLHLNHTTWVVGLAACSHTGALKLGKELHGSAIRSHCNKLSVKNALITMYACCADLTHAYLAFQLIEDKNIVSWNSMIAGYARLDWFEEGSFLFREMLHSSLEPNHLTMSSFLPLCARVVNPCHIKELHCYMTRHEGFQSYLTVWNALVDAYAKLGKVSDAKSVFNGLTKKDEVTYTTLMFGYVLRGEGEAPLQLFAEMDRSKIKPNHLTMVAVLSACCHSGLIAQGEWLFERMRTVYELTPHLEHFDLMIRLYSRAGFLNKARDMIFQLPFRPTISMWITLVQACWIHGNTVVGEWAADGLLEMRPQHSRCYELIAKTYRAVGSWIKLDEVQCLMRNLVIKD